MSRALRWGAVTALVALALIVVTAAFVPVTLTARDGVANPELWQSRGEAQDTVIEVVADSGDPTHLAVTLDWPQRFDGALITSGQSPAEDASVTVAPGDTLVLEGALGDVEITGLWDSGTATAQRDGGDTVALGPGSTVLLPSADQYHTRTTSMLWRSIPAGLDDPANAELTASVAGRTVDLSGLDEAPLSKTAGPALQVALVGWATLLAAAGLLVFACLIGRSLDPSPESGPPREALRAAAGAALFFVLVNTAAYWIPVKWAVAVLIPLAAVVVVMRWIRARPSLGDSATAGGTLLLVASVPGVILFFPVLFWGPSYAGEYKTDLFEYSSLASIVRDHSLIAMRDLAEAQASGTLTAGAGFMWRSIDSVSASVLSLTGLTTTAAFGLLAILLYLIYATALLGLRARAGGGKVATSIVAFTLLAPAFTGLLVEDYYSQYYFVAFVPALILALTLVLDAGRTQHWAGGFLGLAAAAVLAAMGAVYPYFLAVLVIGVVIAALMGRERIRATLRVGPAIAVYTLVLLNLALLTVLNYRETEVYQPGLDGIARNVLLAGFSPLQLVMLGAGFQPYQWRASDQPSTAAMGFPGRAIWEQSADAATPGTLTVVVLVLLIVVTLVAVRWRPSLRSFPFLAALAAVGVWLAFSAYLLAGDSIYAAFKGFWTTACLIPLIFATAKWRGRLSVVVLVLVAAASMLWLRVDLADRANWVITRESREVALSHSSLQPELERAREYMAGATTMGIVRGDQPLVGTDRDRVAFAQLATIARDEDVDCVNCSGANLGAQLACASTAGATQDAPEVIVVVGGSGEPQVCGRSLIYDGKTIEVYR